MVVGDSVGVLVGRGIGEWVAAGTGPLAPPPEVVRTGGLEQVPSIWPRAACSSPVTVSSQAALMVIQSMAYWHQ